MSSSTPVLRLGAMALLLAAGGVQAAPGVSRLTPPSELFSAGRPEPLIARFLPGQRFDLQATLRADPGQSHDRGHGLREHTVGSLSTGNRYSR